MANEAQSNKQTSGPSESLLAEINAAKQRAEASKVTTQVQPQPQGELTVTPDTALTPKAAAQEADPIQRTPVDDQPVQDDSSQPKRGRGKKKTQVLEFETFIDNLKMFNADLGTLNVKIPEYLNSASSLVSKSLGVTKQEFISAALLHFLADVYGKQDAKARVEALAAGDYDYRPEPVRT
jgi:hypothetical protein